MRRQSSNEPTAFKDFNMYREKVTKALLWLKANNYYYSDIFIDNEIFWSLSENRSIVNQLPQIRNDNENLDEDEDGDGEDEITRTLVSSILLTQRKNIVINETLDRIQSNITLMIWSKIDRIPINEF